MKKGLIATTVLALVAVLAAGCSGAPSPAATPDGETVNFRLLISDEPNDIGDFASLNVTISRIGVQQEGEPGVWSNYDLAPKPTVDLTALTGDNATEVFSGYIASGNYTKVFIYTENVTGVLLDGETTTVKLPSGKLQISKPFTLSGDSLVDFVFDITVIKAGKSGKYILKPQIAQSGPDQNFVEVEQEGKPHQLAEVEGTISAVDSEQPDLSLSIIPSGETEAIVLNVNPQTEITLDGEEATLDELGAGDNVTASYYLNNLKATEIVALSPTE